MPGLMAPLSFDGTCHSRLFELWLRVMLCPLLRAGQVVILDNARFHRKKAVQRILKKVGCRALFLPAYSPDLNLIEPQWHATRTPAMLALQSIIAAAFIHVNPITHRHIVQRFHELRARRFVALLVTPTLFLRVQPKRLSARENDIAVKDTPACCCHARDISPSVACA